MRYLNRGGSRGNRRGRRSRLHEDVDPLTGVANLFDVAMIFALGLMVMVLMYMGAQEMNPEQMKEIIEHAKVLETKPQELVTITGEVTNMEQGTMITLGEGEDATILWVNESVEGHG